MRCKTTRNKGTGRLAVSCIVLYEVPSKLNTMYQKQCIFYLVLLRIPSSLVLSVKNRGMGGGDLLNGKNLLMVTKVICR